MMRNYFLFSLLLISFSVQAQQGYIVYKNISNGRQGEERMITIFQHGIAMLNATGTGSELNFINYNTGNIIQFVKTTDGYTSFTSPFKERPGITQSADTENICGIECKKAVYEVNSNKIEIFYNNNFKIKGTPGIGFLPQLGTVLRTVVNGSRITEAVEIKEGLYLNKTIHLPNTNKRVNSQAAFSRAVIESRYRTINIFNNDTINFDEQYPKIFPETLGRSYHYANGNIILKRIKLPEFNKDDGIFLTATQRSNGDAYDRTGCVFAIPVENATPLIRAFQQNDLKQLPAYKAANGKDYRAMVRDENFVVPYELMRFFTPFGIGAFNLQSQIAGYRWPETASYTQDLTDLRSALSGKEIYIMMSVNNWTPGGHIVSLDLKIYPRTNDKNAIAGGSNYFNMLFNTTNVAETMGQGLGDMFGKEPLRVSFQLNKPLRRAYLRYVSTGWGGWENGDEFLPKTNTIFLDGATVFSFIPWRSDCATYRNLNPVSGNFSNGLSSSDLSRSNWCPGTTTNPVYIPLGHLAAGQHEIKIEIPMGAPEGSSYSGWNVSGLLLGHSD